MAKVTIYPSAESVYIDNSKSLLDNLRDAGIYVKSSCGGHATCSDCIVKIKSGEDNINTPTFDEMKLLGNVYHITKERLACQCMVNGDIEIDMSNHSKASDEERRTTKNKKVASKFKVRKKEEFDKILEERQANYLEKQKNRDSWQNHWEKEGVKFEKNLGGNKRPKNLKDLDLAPKKNEKRADNRPPRGERPERSERSDRPRGDRTERSERSDRSGRPDFKNKNFKKPDFKKRPTGKPGFKPDFKPGFKKDKKDKDEE